MPKILIDDSLEYADGCKGKTYIEYADSMPDVLKIADADVLLLELQLHPIEGISGYRLVEEKILPNGSTETLQEFILAPDIAYALFKHWQELDKSTGNNGNKND